MTLTQRSPRPDTGDNRPWHMTVEAPGQIGRAPHDPQALGPRDVRIATLYSGISAGTEMTAFTGSNPFLNLSWDPKLRLFVPGATSWTYPMPAMGYEEVGRVVEVGPEVTKVREGQIVWGTWRHRSEHVADEDWAAVRILPEGVDPRLGIFSQIGSIALNAILDADIHLGETIAVFGQGVPGLMVTELAALSAMPLAALTIARAIDLAPLPTQIAVMFATMPTAPASYVLATRMGGDGPFVAWLITISLLCSLAAIPFWLSLA